MFRKYKLHLFIGGFTCFQLIAFQTIYKQTLQEIELNRDLINRLHVTEEFRYNPNFLKRKESLVNQTLSSYELDSVNHHQDFWNQISRCVHDRKVSVVYDNPLKQQTTDSISNKSIQFLGQYTDLVGLLDDIEKKPKIGRVSSVKFLAEKNQIEQEDVAMYVSVKGVFKK